MSSVLALAPGVPFAACMLTLWSFRRLPARMGHVRRELRALRFNRFVHGKELELTEQRAWALLDHAWVAQKKEVSLMPLPGNTAATWRTAASTPFVRVSKLRHLRSQATRGTYLAPPNLGIVGRGPRRAAR